jgi:hypothetical protein
VIARAGRPIRAGRRHLASMLAFEDGTPVSQDQLVDAQPAWLVGRWVPFEDDVTQAEIHTRRAAAEFQVPADVLDALQGWQEVLTK